MPKHASGPRPDPDGSTPAAAQAGQVVAAVRDDPAQRLRLAAGFYDQRAGGRSIRAYRRAEIAFMRWQIRCGVLSPLDGARLAVIGRFLGDPRRRAANLFLSLQNVLPDTYPLARTNIDTVLADENYLARIMDYGIIAPRIPGLYRTAADDLDEPRIVELCTDEYPVSAWPYEERHVWRTDRSPIAIALVRAVVGGGASPGRPGRGAE